MTPIREPSPPIGKRFRSTASRLAPHAVRSTASRSTASSAASNWWCAPRLSWWNSGIVYAVPRSKASSSLYSQLASRLTRQIERGVFRPGERLPSVRQLKTDHAVSTATAVAALATLEAKGLAEARPRSGYFVSAQQLKLSAPALLSHRVVPRYPPERELQADLMSFAHEPDQLSLAGAVLAPELLPLRHLARLTRAALVKREASLGQYADSRGTPELRRNLARWMGQRGLDVEAKDVVVTAGCSEALRLALSATTQPGDSVVVESPTYFGFLRLARALRLRVVEVPTDPTHGIDPELLERALRQQQISVALLVPSFQNPTGACMSLSRRKQVAELLARHGVPLIEDDVYADLHFSQRRLPPIHSLGLCQGLYCSSLSKAVSPSLNIGWVLPMGYSKRVLELKIAGSVHQPALLQNVAADFLDGGAHQRYLRTLRARLSVQLMRYREVLAQAMPAGTRITQPEGGFLLWLRLPQGVDGEKVATQLLQHNVAVAPGSLFSSAGRHRSYLRISCGTPWSSRHATAMRRIGALSRDAASP